MSTTEKTREEMKEFISYATVVTKCTMEEFAADIEEATGKQVDPESEDLLQTLTTEQVEKVYRTAKGWYPFRAGFDMNPVDPHR